MKKENKLRQISSKIDLVCLLLLAITFVNHFGNWLNPIMALVITAITFLLALSNLLISLKIRGK